MSYEPSPEMGIVTEMMLWSDGLRAHGDVLRRTPKYICEMEAGLHEVVSKCNTFDDYFFVLLQAKAEGLSSDNTGNASNQILDLANSTEKRIALAEFFAKDKEPSSDSLRYRKKMLLTKALPMLESDSSEVRTILKLFDYVF